MASPGRRSRSFADVFSAKGRSIPVLSSPPSSRNRDADTGLTTLTTHQFLSDRAESARRVAFRGLGVGGRVAGGIATVAAAIAEDVRGRVPGQHRKQREGLALLTATMLDVRGANPTDLAASLPRAAGHALPVDRPALGQPADRRGRGGGALRPRAPGPPGGGGPHGRADDRSGPGDSAAPGGRGGGAGRRARPPARGAGQG